ncbi:hypothetical protein L0244_10370 [bacterium]|nr:hypothetical protein [bacterium]
MPSAIATLINTTPELKKKLSDKIVIQVGLKFFVIDPLNPNLHVFTEGSHKDKVMQAFQPLEILDAKGNAFVPTPRGRRAAKK